jgi:ATP-dependent RNA helicase RhlE
MTKFTELGLAEPVLRAIKDQGYDTPSPIQAQAIGPLLEGSDIVGIAQTGTGKTAAFVLPLLSVLGEMEPPMKRGCRVLILAPTRELAAQILESVRNYGKHMHLTSTLVVGGVKPNKQIRDMAPGVDVLVATPGRLEDHMKEGVINLSRTDAVVLDEADQMMDMGFMPAIRRIMGRLPKERQTILFSATMPKPIRALANDFLEDPVEISVTAAAKPVEAIDQNAYLIRGETKPDLLAQILKADDMDRAIVFTRTKRGADKVTRQLDKEGLSAVAIHGNKSQNQRIKALNMFKDGKATIMVATDIAARGIDIDDVSHVVNYELPNIPDAYVHRIGRTARAGRKGVAISLVGNDERAYLRDIETLMKMKINRLDPPEGTALDLSLPEEEGPHVRSGRNANKRSGGGGGGRNRSKSGGGGGGGQGRSRGKRPSGGGKPKGGNRGGNTPSKGTWSPS